jgi:UrcA family protein
MNRVAVAAAVAFAAVLGAQPTFAATADDGVVSVRVPYADLNLQSAAGARIMLARLTAASHSTCGAEPTITDLGRSQLYRGCVSGTLDRAVRSLGAPLVTAAFDGASQTHSEMASATSVR